MPDTNTITELTEQCVRCGLCSQVCPTYQVAEQEAESPRGRIQMAAALANHELKPNNTTMRQHLDNCLTCGACEAACPSNVNYSEIIHKTRQSLKTNYRSLLYYLSSPFLLKTSFNLLFLYEKTGVRSLLKKTKLLNLFKLKPYDDLLPKPLQKLTLNTIYKSHTNTGKTVGLLTGCITPLVDIPVLDAAILLLNQCGFDIVIPKKQYCCGGIAWQQGQTKQAQQLKQNNIDNFDYMGLETIVTLASGCHYALTNHIKTPVNNLVFVNVLDLLSQHCHRLSFKPCKKPVILHIPCTQKAIEPIVSLLKKVPELELHIHQNYCCGAAGMQFLKNTKSSQWLKKHCLQGLKSDANQPESIYLTTNTACQLHLNRADNTAILGAKLQHPLLFLANYLKK